jgi:hypothetical protein
MSAEAMKLALDAMSECLFDEQWYAAKEALCEAIAEFDTHTMYREGYVNGYAFGEAAAKQKAIQEEALRNVQRIGQEIEQEPVAWMQEGQPELYVKEEKDEKRGYVIPLYTHPQPKQEVEQEPVAWMNATRTGVVFREVETSIPNWSDYYNIPLYTHPQIEQDWSTQEAALESLREHMARIKELEAQIERMKSEKPVAWMDSSGHPKHLRHIQNSEERRLYGELQPLYLHPQPATWAGLTDDEIDQGLLRSNYAVKTAEAWRAGVVFAMTKLKEKNT